MNQKKEIYLTYAEGFSGVYKSQVTDVVNFLAQNGRPIRLIALISIRDFLKVRDKIKQASHNAIVLPMFPKLSNINKNIILLWLVSRLVRFRKITARGPLATHLAQKSFGKKYIIVYDGRGANKEEEREYNINAGALTYKQIAEYEKNAVLKSDFRIAVSEKLIDYWCEEFAYTGKNHTVIPCLLGSHFENRIPDIDIRTKIRNNLGFGENDIILVYSGSIASWQSFEFLHDFLAEQIKANNHVKVLFLSKNHRIIDSLSTKFPTRIKQVWLQTGQVYDYLSACDYGILFRENTVTNKVASPVKFAEYLSAGLQVLISENLGDFSHFVKENDCGIVLNSLRVLLPEVQQSKKNKNSRLAAEYFTKQLAYYSVM